MAYAEVYRDDVVENQGRLFDMVAFEHPDADTADFIDTYMRSRTRRAIDDGQAYVATMDYRELWEYFTRTEHYRLRPGEALTGFMPDWIGEFYAYYQWRLDIPSARVIDAVPLSFLEKAYFGLHDLDLDLAAKKAGRVGQPAGV